MDALRGQAVARLAGFGQQEARRLDRVAHHVVQHPAALQFALPEPGVVRAGVFLGGARQVRAAGCPGAALPGQFAAANHGGAEHLVLEVAVQDADLAHEFDHPKRFARVAGERLLAGDADQAAVGRRQRSGRSPPCWRSGGRCGRRSRSRRWLHPRPCPRSTRRPWRPRRRARSRAPPRTRRSRGSGSTRPERRRPGPRSRSGCGSGR